MVRRQGRAGSAGDIARKALCRAVAIVAVAGVAWVASAAPASALSVTVPTDTARSLTATVTLSATDPGGMLELLVDGSVAATRAVSPDTQSVFAGLPVVPGRHVISAVVHGSGQYAGTDVSAPDAVLQSWGVPGAPALLSPSGPAVSNLTNVVVRAGVSTTKVTIAINGVWMGTSATTPGSAVSFGLRSNTAGWTVYTVTVANPIGETGSYSYGFRRIDTPYPTMIVVEKGTYQLHWIVDYQMVRTYPVAHGKRNITPVGTWKMGAKYTSDPGGIYGPRKMRLFRMRSSRRGRPGRWQSTGYLIHGTNQPWVIGTMASHGCIRMYNWDVLDLWPQVPVGTPVETRR